jgi:hypothetical protein
MKSRRTAFGREALAAIPWFAALPPGRLDLATRHAEWIGVEGGSLLQRQGRHVGWLWIPTNDSLVLRDGDRAVGEVAIGEAWGETEALLGAPSTVDVVARAWLTVVSLPTAVFHGMLGDAAFAASVARRQARASAARVPHPGLELVR